MEPQSQLKSLLGSVTAPLQTALPYLGAAQSSMEGASSIQDFSYNRNMQKDPEYLKENLASSLASPLVGKATEFLDTQLDKNPAFRGMLEQARTNKDLRKSIVTGDNPILKRLFDDFEENWVNKQFNKRRAGIAHQTARTGQVVGGQAQLAASRAQLMNAAQAAIQRQAKRGPGKLTTKAVIADLLKGGYSNAGLIKGDIENILATNKNKRGLALVHKNLRHSRVQNSIADINRNAATEGRKAQTLGAASQKIQALNQRVLAMRDPRQAAGPRFNVGNFIDKAQKIHKLQEQTRMNKTNTLKLANYLNFLKQNSAEISDKRLPEEKEPIGKVLKLKKGDLAEYMANLGAPTADSEGKDNRRDDEKKEILETSTKGRESLLGDYLQALRA